MVSHLPSSPQPPLRLQMAPLLLLAALTALCPGLANGRSSELDVIAVLSIATCAATWELHDILRTDTLHMAITDSPCARLPPHQAITVPITAVKDELAQLVLDLRSGGALSWNSAVVLFHQQRQPVKELQANIVEAMTRNDGGLPIALSFFELAADHTRMNEKVLQLFRKIAHGKLSSHILAVVPESLASVLLHQAKEQRLMTPYYQWLLIVPDVMNPYGFIDLLRDGSNVAFICNTSIKKRDCLEGIYCHISEVAHSFVAALSHTIQQEKNISQQVSEDEWDILQPSKREHHDAILAALIEQLDVKGKCDACRRWTIFAAETWGVGAVSSLPEIGIWTTHLGTQLTNNLFPHSAHKFCGRNLQVLSFHSPPWQIIHYNATRREFQYEGVFFKVLSVLSERLNFRYRVIFLLFQQIYYSTHSQDAGKLFSFHITYCNPPNNASWASKVPHCCSCSFGGGVVASLFCVLYTVMQPTDHKGNIANDTDLVGSDVMATQQQSVFIGAAAFIINDAHKLKVNFTFPLGTVTYTFLSARPRELSRAGLFIRPFGNDTWLCVVASVLMMAMLLYWMNHLSVVPRLKKVNGLAKMVNCFWYMYGALLQQGGANMPKADSSRLLVGTWWLVVLVLVTSYSGNLVAFLTFPILEAPLTSVRLMPGRGLSWGLITGSSLEQLLKTSDDPELHKLHEDAVQHKELNESLLSMLASGDHILLHSRLTLRRLTRIDLRKSSVCRFMIGDENFVEEEVAMILPKDSPYLEMINEEIRRLKQSGLIEKWEADSRLSGDRCTQIASASDVSNHKVNMADMQGCFFVLLLGTAAASITITMEHIFHLYTKSRERRLVKPFII
ncbi:ionotropic receptor 93a [Schistocerca piceifrons]|uniref:ionotropic receptor 93a n=1 Tax=Schistocerca piceifrons TaxID=274613 RepID=UPI001F5EF5A2|nr:ionotropic receptor 93a [Schistocerca piceifrons]